MHKFQSNRDTRSALANRRNSLSQLERHCAADWDYSEQRVWEYITI